MKISIIVAIAENNAIGKNNDLLWHLSDDLKRFKKLTTGQTIVMGKKTFFSLPVRPLPNRQSIVITDVPDETFEGCITTYSVKDAINQFSETGENFIIGGGSVYAQFLPYADKLYLTKVHQSFDADVFFPEINFEEWDMLEKADVLADEKNEFNYSYYIYKRKNK
jgi:dihydrofolate reductase